ncbi:hypothetical protein BN135_1988 [Cronobacter muytjensii 530]
MQHVRGRQWANLFAHPVSHFAVKLCGGFLTVIQRHVSVNRLAFDTVRNTHHGGFGDFRMRHQRRFNLRRAETMAGDVQHVIHAPGYPVVAIFVATRAVATEIHVFKGRKIGLLETLVIAEQRTRLAWPGVGNHQVAFSGALLGVAFVIHQRWLHPKEWTRGGTGLELGRARQRRYHEAAGFGLPPGVDNRAFFVADFLPVPLPGFRVDGLAHRAENAQRRAVSAVDGFIAFGHQRANGCRRGIENIDLMLIHHLRHAVGGWPVWHAFKHQRGRAAGERPVEQIAVSRNPAHIRSTPVNIALMVIEGVQKGCGRINQITAGGVQHPFRFAGRAGGIEDK